MALSRCPSLIGGEWVDLHPERFGEVFNPSTGEAIAHVPMSGVDEVNLAVETANRAFPAWRDTPAVDRARIMFRFRDLLVRHADDVAGIVTREHGKTLPEAKASVQRGIEMVEFACGLPSMLTGECIENIAPHVDCETMRHPLGVTVGITPFNFPAMVPLWMYPVSLVCGNTFVLKPSPRVPLSAIRIVELLLEAGLPEGVLSLIHGDKECVDLLLRHPLVKAVSFVGSTAVAKSIYEVGTAHGKRVQAAGGAKNHLIIMPDADLDATTTALISSAFGCAGERCMAGSLAVPVGDVADEFVARLSRQADAMRVGRTDEGGEVDMGPVISQSHLESIERHLSDAESEGAQLALDGRKASCRGEGYFIGPSIVDHVKPTMRISREEVFGPVLSVNRVETVDDAIALGDGCDYGNGAVIFTRSGRAAREFKRRFNAGMIGINVGVPAPMAWFPFTGWNNSFFGDLHIQGKEGMLFYTQQKMTMSRWPAPQSRDAEDPVWRSTDGRH